MEHTSPLIGLIPLFPLLTATLIGLMTLFFAHKGQGAPKGLVSALAVAGPLASFLVSCVLFFQLRALPEAERALTQTVFPWIHVGPLQIDVSFLLDPLSAMMILMVTGIGTLIHLYSVGYMSHDRGFSRYFAYLNLFMFSMLVLVLGSSLPLMFVGWEGVGLCSYLLIGFWFTDIAKANAGNKAFIANRVGDFGFLLGMFFIFFFLLDHGTATLDFAGMKQQAALFTPYAATAAALLLFVGAMGKSAQFPLHVWLADAMAGPTPVSALIHAATMVTAGIYMVARMGFLFAISPSAGLVVASVGALTAIFAATIAIAQSDIKKVLAYSTVSQLGYMFIGVGLGAYFENIVAGAGAAIFAVGMFHVFTHAFFKALLFLGSGSVIHACHEEQDIWKMGGLKAKMPITWATMGIGTLAIAGLPPLAGFFSKEAILTNAFIAGHYQTWLYGIYAIALVTSGLTAFYMFRMFFLTFHGKPRDQHIHDHAHESPLVMTFPLMALALGTVVVGFLNVPKVLSFGFLPTDLFASWLEPALKVAAHGEAHMFHPSATMDYFLMAVAIGVALVGIVFAYLRYAKPAPATEPTKALWWEILWDKYYVDEMIQAVVIEPILKLSGFLRKGVDEEGLDYVVNNTPKAYAGLSNAVRVIQTGMVRSYAYLMVLGMFAILLYYFLHLAK
ncbi:NADH-quinone oxidoreductase subunit 12 [compost metagenome]